MVFVVCSQNGVVVVLGARKTKVFGGISLQNGSNNYWIFFRPANLLKLFQKEMFITHFKKIG